MSDLLTAAESSALAKHEQVIERGIQTFTEVGNALLRIRDGRLYRADFGTFEDYCRERWNFSYQRAHQMIRAASVVSTIVETGLPTPTNEGQARELAKVPGPERAEVWRETVERTGGKPTAAAIRETYRPAPAPRPGASHPEPDDEAAQVVRAPAVEPGIWYGGPGRPEQVDDRTCDDAQHDAELAAAIKDTDAVFRRNFHRELSAAFTLAKDADIDRIVRVFGAPGGDRDALLRSLAYVRDWCDQTVGALNKTVQLRAVGGAK